MIQTRFVRGMALTGAILMAGACAPLDTVFGDSGAGSPFGRSITGEVRSLDSRRGRIQVREDHGSRTHTINFDNRTRVVYNQRQYSASSLERGDLVRVSVTHDRSGTAWADRIDVQRTVRDSRNTRDSRAYGRVERIDGTVRGVDSRRGTFLLEHSRSRMVTVQVPRGVGSGDARRFDRLSRGDRVRVEVRRHSSDDRYVELVRFR
jgi:hypothetical protein